MYLYSISPIITLIPPEFHAILFCVYNKFTYVTPLIAG